VQTIIEFLPFVGGLVALLAGAEILVRASSSIGLRLGMHPVTVGATIVGFGTSAPELVVSLLASIKGEPGIAMGNVVGSNVANIGLVLGLSALIRPIIVDPRIPRFEYPFTLLTAVALPFLVMNSLLSFEEGVALSAAIVLFIALYLGRKKDAPAEVVVPATTRFRIPSLAMFCFLGLGMLIGGSHFVVEGAKLMALRLGMSETAVSSTIVAVGTSLPEVATSIVAALKGAHGLILGNVLGSNIFNSTLVLGPSAMAREMPIDDLTRTRLIPFMLVLTMLLFPLLKTGRRVSRFEGLLLLAAYSAFIALLAPWSS
jgi:cation:H+ antiporter